ncbi:ribonuclease VapC [Thermus composti]|uniref:Ribonuclease VapC n=1 Tax=Thermus composti TaxID=532059 RepID=A0ABV6Q3H7_9DEIN|nr:type II toxin-antitoxin system VapC family toxin [Thermus composti]GGM94862.1 ribonuclease VapC [Thermus composti]
MTSAWVLDASVAVVAVTGHPLRAKAQGLLQRAIQEERLLLVPRLFASEVASALRRAAFHGALTQEAAERSLYLILKLPWVYTRDEDLALSALRWAARLGQVRAYDAFYVALAEAEGAEFWTADGRLVQGLRALGFSRARALAEDL